MFRLACLAAVLSAAPLFATEPTQAERERKVRVALALAHATPVKAVAAAPSKFDWFGDGAAVASAKPGCTCGPDCKCAPGTCPGGCLGQTPGAAMMAKALPKFRVEYRQECEFNRFGQKTGCHWVEYHVPIEAAK